MKARPPWLPPFVDLRSQTRFGSQVETRIDLIDPVSGPIEWLATGALYLIADPDHDNEFVSAYFDETIKDESCKLTFALFFDVTKTKLVGIRDAVTIIEATLPTEKDEASVFKVPRAPFDLTTLHPCPLCPSTPDKHWLFTDDPDDDWDLWSHVAGWKIQIRTGPLGLKPAEQP
jgi:hypothetical protein